MDFGINNQNIAIDLNSNKIGFGIYSASKNETGFSLDEAVGQREKDLVGLRQI